MSQEQMVFYKIFAPIFSIGILFYFSKYLTKQDKNSQYWNMILFISMLFPLCKSLQMWQIGSRFFRHHITDFGYIPLFALTIFLYPLNSKYKFIKNKLTFLGYKLRFVTCLKISLIFCLIIEIAQLRFISKEVITSGKPVAAGDIVDIFMYIMSYFICKTLYDIYVYKLKVF